MRRIRPASRAAPLIARICGLPADAVERFSTPLGDELRAWRQAQDALDAARAELVDQLHALVSTATPELRRFILAVKRDAFNARPLAKHLRSPSWLELAALAGPVAGRAAAAEDETARRAAAFDAAFARERDRQRELLATHLDDRTFVRGLALASPGIGWIGHRLRAPGPGQKRKKAELTLLRYVSRAAVKTSPFSTLTPVALATLRGGMAPQPPRLRGSGWRARSLVRVKPYLLRQYGEMLRRHPPFRDTLQVALNSSVAETEPGRFLFLRPGHWAFDETAGRLGYREQSLVNVNMRGPLISRLLEILPARRLAYGELLSMLRREFAERGTADRVEGELDQLIQLGFLYLDFPWSGHEMHLEARMLRHLRTLPGEEGLDRFVALLDRLVGLERGYADSTDPEASVREIERLLDELWRAAAPLGGADPGAVGLARASARNVYEEVVLTPRAGEGGPAIVHLSRAAAEEALRSVEPLVRLSALFDHRHDFHHSLADLARERWPSAGEVGVVELFHQAQPLWRDYMAFRRAAGETKGWRTTWNPRGCPESVALDRDRTAVLDALPACLSVRDGVQHLSIEGLTALLNRVPARYTSAEGGACLFLQAASTDGSLWVLNRMKEGTGRFSTRYTPAMSRRMRAGYVAQLAARGTFDAGGEAAELLDLRCVQGDNLNVHALQTPSALALPGEGSRSAPARQVTLRDLRVAFEGPGRRPVLRGRDGRRYVPAFLGLAHEDYIPPVIRFLCAFGPSEMSTVLPPRASESDGGVTASRRTVAGNVVLHRRSWSFVPALVREELGEEIAGMDDARVFAAIDRWRARRGIPDRVFLIEQTSHPIEGVRTQPQYLDFTSPLFVALFRSALEAQSAPVALVEMLPSPEMFSADDQGRRWAVEVLLDSIALRPEAVRSPMPELPVHPGPLAAT